MHKNRSHESKHQQVARKADKHQYFPSSGLMFQGNFHLHNFLRSLPLQSVLADEEL